MRYSTFVALAFVATTTVALPKPQVPTGLDGENSDISFSGLATPLPTSTGGEFLPTALASASPSFGFQTLFSPSGGFFPTPTLQPFGPAPTIFPTGTGAIGGSFPSATVSGNVLPFGFPLPIGTGTGTGTSAPAPTSGLLSCGSAQYLPSQYTCFNGNFLCPIIDGDATQQCGDACYSTSAYTCYNGQLIGLGGGSTGTVTGFFPSPTANNTGLGWTVDKLKPRAPKIAMKLW